MELLTALKINILSVISLPFLFIATVAKMTEKALAKIKTVFIMLLLTVITVVIVMISNNRSILPDNLRTIMIIIAVAGVALAALGVIFKVVSVIYKIITAGVRMIFDTIYKGSYSLYMSLMNTAASDYYDLCEYTSSLITVVCCIFYHLNKMINVFIRAFIRVSLLLFVIASGGFAYLWYTEIAGAVRETFGLSLSEYLNGFGTWSLISSVLLFIVIVADVAVILISLGMEWTKWSGELSFDEDDQDRYMDMLEDDEESFETLSIEQDDENLEYYEIVSDHLGGAGDLMEEIRRAQVIQNNPLLENASNEYFRSLSDITGEISKSKGNMDPMEFAGLKPFIKHLDRLRDGLYKIIDRQYELADSMPGGTSFFSGCNTVEKLNKRYKALCKAYHPDNEGGDEETFIAIKQEYEELKKEMEG